MLVLAIGLCITSSIVMCVGFFFLDRHRGVGVCGPCLLCFGLAGLVISVILGVLAARAY
jgi:hypothetical protein